MYWRQRGPFPAGGKTENGLRRRNLHHQGIVGAFARHRATIYRLLRQGRLPGFRVGADWRFSRAAIEQWERLQALSPQQPVARERRRRGE